MSNKVPRKFLALNEARKRGYIVNYATNALKVTGIYLENDVPFAARNVLSDNRVPANSQYRIWLWNSSRNVLSDNSATANGYTGIGIWYSGGNVLAGNVMANNLWSFSVYGSVLSDFVNQVDTSNLVDGGPMCYLVNQSNTEISP